MIAADYLKSRGWLDTGVADDGVDCWADPTALEMDGLAEEDALTIQRARDATEERAAWVRFAAARLAWGIAGSSEGPERWDSIGEEANEADKMLALYRARFAVEVES